MSRQSKTAAPAVAARHMVWDVDFIEFPLPLRAVESFVPRTESHQGAIFDLVRQLAHRPRRYHRPGFDANGGDHAVIVQNVAKFEDRSRRGSSAGSEYP